MIMESLKDDMTTKELTACIDALGSAVKAQQPLNQAVYDRLNELEVNINRIRETQVGILDILAGDPK